MATSRDPEVERLTQSIRQLTGRARTLSKDIDETVTELKEFRDDVVALRGNMQSDRRSSSPGVYTGQERRRR